jgi:protein TonB
MFEDSTFESTGKIRTRSRDWAIAAFAFNGTIVLALILIPLIYPQMLPHQVISYLADLQAPRIQPQKPPVEPLHVVHVSTEARNGQFTAPAVIPKGIFIVDKREVLDTTNVAEMGPGFGDGIGTGTAFPSHSATPNVRVAPAGPVRVPSTVVAGMLVHKTIPVYPPIAIAARAEGTVVLQATISTGGTIENLRVASGPGLLQQAALDAVKTWRYRPYLLNGQAVEVETTVNVVFTLSR